MPVKIIAVPYSYAISRENHALMQAMGTLDQHQKQYRDHMESALAELDKLLNAGYVRLDSHVLQSSTSTEIVYTLWDDSDSLIEYELPNPPGDGEQQPIPEPAPDRASDTPLGMTPVIPDRPSTLFPMPTKYE